MATQDALSVMGGLMKMEQYISDLVWKLVIPKGVWFDVLR